MLIHLKTFLYLKKDIFRFLNISQMQNLQMSTSELLIFLNPCHVAFLDVENYTLPMEETAA